MVWSFGFGNCADVAFFLKQRYEAEFAFGRYGPSAGDPLPVRPMVVIRGVWTMVPGFWLENRSKWCHGANLIVPTDSTGGPLLVWNPTTGHSLPSYSDIFTTDVTTSNFLYTGDLDPDSMSSQRYQAKVWQRQDEARSKMKAWQNALVVDGWRNVHMTLAQWKARKWTLFGDFYTDKYDTIEIGVKATGSAAWDDDLIVQLAAYNQGCIFGRRARLHPDRAVQILEAERPRWYAYSNPIIIEAFDQGVTHGKEKKIGTAAVDKQRIEVLDGIQDAFAQIKITGLSYAPGPPTANGTSTLSMRFDQSPERRLAVAERSLAMLQAKTPKLYLYYRFGIDPWGRAFDMDKVTDALPRKNARRYGFMSSGTCRAKVRVTLTSCPTPPGHDFDEALAQRGRVYGPWGEVLVTVQREFSIEVSTRKLPHDPVEDEPPPDYPHR